jgi:hypothetical protein
MAEDLKRLIVEFHTACFGAHESALKAFFTGDIGLAEGVRDMRGNLEKKFADIEKVTRNQSLDVVPKILAVASILRQIYEHSVDISDLVMPKKV